MYENTPVYWTKNWYDIRGYFHKEGELDEKSTCAKNAQVQLEGTRKISRIASLYNLDVLISVGYRVKSHQVSYLKR